MASTDLLGRPFTKRRRLAFAAAAVGFLAVPLIYDNKISEKYLRWTKKTSLPRLAYPSLVASPAHRVREKYPVAVDQLQLINDTMNEEFNYQAVSERTPRWLEDQGADNPQQDGNENNNMDEGDDDGLEDQGGDDDEQEKAQRDDDGAEASDDAAFNDDEAQGDNVEADEDQQQHEEDDDYFDDKVADDQLTDDDMTIEWDDFYAYQDDWRPPDLFPLTTRKLIAYALIIIASTLGASGGIGGGGIVLPVYILCIGLPLKVAVPISAATCLGGGLGSTIINIFFRRHPLADRPLIDWDLVMLMSPLTLVGTLLGTLFHRVISEKILVILLVMLLSLTAHTTLTKAMRMYHAEKRYIRHLKAAQAPPPAGTPPAASDAYSAWTEEQSSPNQAFMNPLMDLTDKQRILILNPDYVTLRSDLAQQDKFTPRTKILALIGMMFVLTFLSINPWGIRCGSLLFYSNYLFMIIYLVACAWAAQTYVVARAEVKDLVRFDYVHGDIKWNAKTAVLYPTIFVAAGFFAGTLGIGGGVILVPLLMHFGLHPSVASASSSAMILMTSFSSTTSYIIYNVLLTDYAILGFGLGFCSAIVGQSIMRYLRQATSASGRNFERNSYVAFVIGGVVLISALLMTIQYVLLIVQEPDDFSKGVCDGISY